MDSSKIVKLNSIEAGKRPKVLLVGNGIAMVAEPKSWQDMIEEILKKYRSDINYKTIKDLPENMQIVVASNDNVDKELDTMRSALTYCLNDDDKSFYKEILALPVDAVLTTNYDYTLEQALGIEFGQRYFQNCRRWTNKSCRSVKDNLFRFSDCALDDIQKRIWHVHGDICRKDSMIMGHYYYGKYVSAIVHYISRMKGRLHSANKKGYDFIPESWVDYFLLGDVYILGFGLCFTETDLWWLINFKIKEEEFSDTNIYYYQPSKKIDCSLRRMLEVYNVHIEDSFVLEDEGGYRSFYRKCIFDIQNKMKQVYR